MIVLGAQMAVEMATAQVTVMIEPRKAHLWAEALRNVLASGKCDAGAASKFAGRLGFAITTAADRVGRAYVKPCYVQARSPLPGHRISTWFRAAALCFLGLPGQGAQGGRECPPV
eukprot:16428282-Heterocapsa_arctica.AAC.1